MTKTNWYNDTVPLIEAALENCEEVESRVREDPDRRSGELPESAGEFVEEVRPKLESVLKYANDHKRVTYNQFRMVQGIAGGLERWLQVE